MKYTLVLFLVNTCFLPAQKHDYNWLTGYKFREDTIQPAFGITRFDFNSPSLNPKISYDTFKRIDFLGTNNSISNFEGQYQFSYNGYIIEDNQNKVIKNGIFAIAEPAENLRQISTIIPCQNNNKYFLVTLEIEIFGSFAGSKYLFLTEIDSTIKGIEIKRKKEIIIEDTLQIGYLTAVKHSNGRDWWIFAFLPNSNDYYSILLNGDIGSIIEISINYLEFDHSRANDAAVINQLGTKLAVASIHDQVDINDSYLDIFDIDRNTGKLTISKRVMMIDPSSYQMLGVAFSPNSKYLYVSKIDYILQIDMESDSLVFDTVARYDGFTSYVPEDRPGSILAHTKFGFLDLAPDGRIYGTTSCCTQRHMFVIDKPNLKGKACDVRQHSLKITVHKDIPTFPNYRLGPIDGSLSDTLDINNIPVAEFRYDQDTSEYKKIEFTNLSWYEPEEWWWDWGDGSPMYYTTVWDTSITHIYAKDGVYQVCLRAKNMYGEHTICKELKLGTTGSISPISNITIQMYPNPAHDVFVIHIEDYLPAKMLMTIYELQGEEVLHKRLYQGNNMIDLENMNAGVYIVEIREHGMLVRSEKLMKM